MYDSSSRRELGAALAAAFLAGAWNEDRLVRRGADVLEPRPRWLRAVVREVLAAYHRPPADRPRELAAYVVLALEERRGVAAAPRVRRWRDFTPAMARTRWPVPPIASPGELADRLGLDVGQLAWLADVRGLERRVADARLRHYVYDWRPRRGAPPRPIARPKHRLKTIQRWILHEILDPIPAHDAAHGFVRGRSARTHAAARRPRERHAHGHRGLLRLGAGCARLRHLPHRRLSPGGGPYVGGAVRDRRPARRMGSARTPGRPGADRAPSSPRPAAGHAASPAGRADLSRPRVARRRRTGPPARGARADPCCTLFTLRR